jgi:glycosyltransferase involved in cell wall biosynthesis
MLSAGSWVVLAGLVGAIVFWTFVWLRIHLFMRSRPSIRAGILLPAPARGWPRLSIIVPAHNEQRVINRCVTSLRAQEYADLEIIFVLDRCTDDTRAILKRHADEDDRVIIIDNDSCPDDWAGKCNALRLGAEHATGAYLLFTDADTGFDPKLARAAVALAHDQDIALLTLLSTLTVQTSYERLGQPVASMSLMKLFPLNRINLPSSTARPFANGQFLLFERSWYDKIGGHHAVHEALLEDLAFAKCINEANGRISVLLAEGMLVVSMYGTFDAFRRGWKRIFIEACQRKPARLRKNANRLLALGYAVPVLLLAGILLALVNMQWGDFGLGLALFITTVLAVLLQMGSLLRMYAMAGAPRSATLFYSVGCVMIAKIMREAARDLETRTPIQWGGREYVLEPR